MKPFLSILCLAVAYLCHRATLKTRGKGSWKADQALTRTQGALLATSLLLWFI